MGMHAAAGDGPAFDRPTALRLIRESMALVDKFGADPISCRDVDLLDGGTLVVEIVAHSTDATAVPDGGSVDISGLIHPRVEPEIAYDEEARWLRVRRGPFLLVANFSRRPSHVPLEATVEPVVSVDVEGFLPDDYVAAVNQRLKPNDFQDAGVGWHDLSGPHAIHSGTLVVQLSDAANGYVIAAGINVAFLWFVTVAPGWRWLPFLTEDFSRVVGLVTLSFVISIAVNLDYIGLDPRWVKRLGDALTTAVAFVVLLQLARVFPFDFGPQWAGWEAPFRVLLGLGCVGAAIGVIANLVMLVREIAGSNAGVR
jgi:hypothetical protein